MAELRILLLEGRPRGASQEVGDPEVAPLAAPPMAFMRRLANAAWRLRNLAGQLGTGEVEEWTKERIELLEELLRREGVETIDYTGRSFDPQEIWDDVVGSRQEKRNPTIASMREPRILYRGSVLARGTPIVEEGP